MNTMTGNVIDVVEGIHLLCTVCLKALLYSFTYTQGDFVSVHCINYNEILVFFALILAQSDAEAVGVAQQWVCRLFLGLQRDDGNHH